MIKVSVVTATYNAASKLGYSIPSVLSQHGVGEAFELEVIAVDDCSTDNTVEILREMGVTVHVNEKNSGGPNKGRNKALGEATGDYICFFDQDDEWKPDKIIQQLRVREMAPIITNGIEVRNASTGVTSTIGCSDEEVRTYAPNETFLNKLQRLQPAQCTDMSSIMIHASLKHILFEETHGMLDYDWTLRLFENRASVQVNRPLVVRHVEGRNLSLNKRYRITDYNFAMEVLNRYEPKYPTECALARKRFNGTRARFHYEIGEMREARAFFLRSDLSLKTLLYYITTFAGSEWVKKRFRVFT